MLVGWRCRNVRWNVCKKDTQKDVDFFHKAEQLSCSKTLNIWTGNLKCALNNNLCIFFLEMHSGLETIFTLKTPLKLSILKFKIQNSVLNLKRKWSLKASVYLRERPKTIIECTLIKSSRIDCVFSLFSSLFQVVARIQKKKSCCLEKLASGKKVQLNYVSISACLYQE